MIDIPAFLDAIAAVESSSSNGLRFEPSYMPKGTTFWVQGRLLTGTGRNVNAVVAERWSRWGIWSAASYSPWQILYHVAADRGFPGSPTDLLDPAIARPWVEAQISHLISRGRTDLLSLASAWNAGLGGSAPEYARKVSSFYKPS